MSEPNNFVLELLRNWKISEENVKKVTVTFEAGKFPELNVMYELPEVEPDTEKLKTYCREFMIVEHESNG